MSKQLVVGGFLAWLGLLLMGCWPMPNRISVSPDGKFIALSMPAETQGHYEAFSEKSQLWLLERATAQLVTAINDGAAVWWATWSPDSQELLYVASDGLQEVPGGMIAKQWRLMLYSPATGERRQLLADRESSPWGLSFSPDGQKIAYYRATESKLEIVLFDRASGDAQVIQTAQADGQLNYMPYGPNLLWLGEKLVLVRVEELLPNGDLPVMGDAAAVRVVRGRVVRLSLDCYCEEEIARGYYPLLPTPTFIIASADGRRLYLNGYPRSFAFTPDEPINLYEIDIAERQTVAIYEGEGIALAPALSPDSTQLLFTVLERQQGDLYLRSFQSLSPAAKLTHDGHTGFGFWLTNEEIGFLRRVPGDRPAGELWRKNLITGAEEPLTPILALQRYTAQLNVQLASAQQEAQRYKEEITQTQEALKELQKEIQSLNESLQKLNAELPSQSQQTVEQISRQFVDAVQQINALNRAVAELKKQSEDLEAKLVELQRRPTLELWSIALVVALAALCVIWVLRRSLGTLAQQLAFPPQ